MEGVKKRMSVEEFRYKFSRNIKNYYQKKFVEKENVSKEDEFITSLELQEDDVPVEDLIGAVEDEEENSFNNDKEDKENKEIKEEGGELEIKTEPEIKEEKKDNVKKKKYKYNKEKKEKKENIAKEKFDLSSGSVEINFEGNESMFLENHKENPFCEARHLIHIVGSQNDKISGMLNFRIKDLKRFEFDFEIKSPKIPIWVGVGLCDIKLVESNKGVFYKPRNNDFHHGTFLLGSVKQEDGYKVIIFHSDGNYKGSYKIIDDFPYFIQNRKIHVSYETITRKLSFTCGICYTEINDVVTRNQEDLFAPCVVFFEGGTTIELSNFEKTKNNF